jgi:protein O-GlcNAc transferase
MSSSISSVKIALAMTQEKIHKAIHHHQSGRLAKAEALYRQVLATHPEHPDALHLLGVVALQQGKFQNSEDLIRKALRHRPRTPEYHGNLGLALERQGKFEQAVAAYRTALDLKRDFPQAQQNLADTLKKMGRLDEAIAIYRARLAGKPGTFDLYNNLGDALLAAGQKEEAIACLRKAAEMAPDSGPILFNLGSTLAQSGRMEEAVAFLRRALELQPDNVDTLNNLGNALGSPGHWEEAIGFLQRAVAARPNDPKLIANLANAVRGAGLVDESIELFQKVVELDPKWGHPQSDLAAALMETGRHGESIAAFARAVELEPALGIAGSNLAYNMHFPSGIEPREIYDVLREWNHRHAEPLKSGFRPHENDRNPDRRLRIGYVSPDFKFHPVGRFLRPLFAHHDKSQVEIFCYSDVRRNDEMTATLRGFADQWRDVVAKTDEQIAEIVRQDQIDILVDLTLHTADNRLMVFARKPAPVQATYLAYCGTSGLDAMDYRVTDPYLDPIGGDESCYSERTIRLAHNYWCYEMRLDLPDAPQVPAAKTGSVTFGCLNSFRKVSDATWETWIALLQAVPGSRLLVHALDGKHRERSAAKFSQAGLDPGRLQFVGAQGVENYFRQYGEIDIALDPFPFCGGTTTCDALWMGTPVVTLRGRTAVGRGGVSILSNIGLTELIAENKEEYVRIAAELAGDLPRLSALRGGLRERMRNSPLMDAGQFARDMETAYREMWRRWASA